MYARLSYVKRQVPHTTTTSATTTETAHTPEWTCHRTESLVCPAPATSPTHQWHTWAVSSGPDCCALAGLRLVGLLQQVPPLLEACVSDDRLTLTRLRLVNEECSRSALLGLKSFTITLDGSGRDADARVARLLQHARLRDLHVYVRLSGTQRLEQAQ